MEYISQYEKTLTGVWRPCLPVKLIGSKGKSCNFSMLIDSGADRSVVNLSAGKYLGFDFEDTDVKTQISGIGGSLTAVYKKLKIIMFDNVINIKVCWVLSDNVPLLIGRDVFDFFHITFKQDEKVTVFKWILK